MYENSIEKDWKAASTTCRPGAGEAGGERVIVAVMLGEEDCFAATNGISKMKATRFLIEAMTNSDIEHFMQLILSSEPLYKSRNYIAARCPEGRRII
jgi:hypothetical protein